MNGLEVVLDGNSAPGVAVESWVIYGIDGRSIVKVGPEAGAQVGGCGISQCATHGARINRQRFTAEQKRTDTGAISEKPLGGITLASGARPGAINVSTIAGVIFEGTKEDI